MKSFQRCLQKDIKQPDQGNRVEMSSSSTLLLSSSALHQPLTKSACSSVSGPRLGSKEQRPNSVLSDPLALYSCTGHHLHMLMYVLMVLTCSTPGMPSSRICNGTIDWKKVQIKISKKSNCRGGEMAQREVLVGSAFSLQNSHTCSAVCLVLPPVNQQCLLKPGNCDKVSRRTYQCMLRRHKSV